MNLAASGETIAVIGDGVKPDGQEIRSIQPNQVKILVGIF